MTAKKTIFRACATAALSIAALSTSLPAASAQSGSATVHDTTTTSGNGTVQTWVYEVPTPGSNSIRVCASMANNSRSDFVLQSGDLGLHVIQFGRAPIVADNPDRTETAFDIIDYDNARVEASAGFSIYGSPDVSSGDRDAEWLFQYTERITLEPGQAVETSCLTFPVLDSGSLPELVYIPDCLGNQRSGFTINGGVVWPGGDAQAIQDGGDCYPAEIAPKAFEIADAGIGEGPSCDTGAAEDMLPRGSVSSSDYAAETVILNTSFDSGNDYLVLSGSWDQSGGDLRQVRDCGYDYTALLSTPQVEHFRFETKVRALAGVNQGGIVFNQSSRETRSGAMIVDLANGGTVLRWGTYDSAGYYQYIGSVDVTSNGTDSIAVEVRGSIVDIEFNGVQVASTTTTNPGGYVGLVSTLSAVAFEGVKLTALPAA